MLTLAVDDVDDVAAAAGAVPARAAFAAFDAAGDGVAVAVGGGGYVGEIDEVAVTTSFDDDAAPLAYYAFDEAHGGAVHA